MSVRGVGRQAFTLLAAWGVHWAAWAGSGPSPDRAEALVGAAWETDFKAVVQCVTRGAPVDGEVGPGLTAWQAAQLRGREDIARYLVEKGANTNRAFPVPERLLEWQLPQLIAPEGPGYALAVVHEGKVVFEGAWGLANLEDRSPIRPDTVFHVASVSKQFTAFAVALLEAEGKLSIEDPVRRHLPWVPDFGKTITLRQLLNHTSGLRDQWDLWVMSGRRLEDVITQADLLRLIEHQRELNFPPGEEHLYSNSGFTLAAETVARVSGRSFLDFTRERIFEPLGMTNTHFHLDYQEVVPRVACSYDARDGGGYRKCILSFGNVGATSLYTTARDLARWLIHLQEPRVGGTQVVARLQERAKLNSGREIDYGLGFSLGKYRGARTVNHGGADAGYRSFLLWVPEQRWGVAVLANRPNPSVADLAYRVADVYLRGRLAPVDPPKDTGASANSLSAVDPDRWKEYPGTYRLRPHWLMTISLEGGKLQAQATRESRFPLTPLSDTNFFVEAYQAAIEFPREASGGVKELVYRGIRAPRIAVATPTPDELAAYAGDYWSEELRVLCSLEVRDGRLGTTYPTGDWQRLTPGERDSFDADGGAAVDFTRDSSGKIDGIRVSTERVRGLRFTRVTFRQAR